MLLVRKQHAVLQVGDFQVFELDNEDILSYFRFIEEEKILVVLNMSAVTQQVTLPCKVSQILLNTLKNWIHIEDPAPSLLPYQGVIYAVE
jgi:glycosidase